MECPLKAVIFDFLLWLEGDDSFVQFDASKSVLVRGCVWLCVYVQVCSFSEGNMIHYPVDSIIPDRPWLLAALCLKTVNLSHDDINNNGLFNLFFIHILATPSHLRWCELQFFPEFTQLLIQIIVLGYLAALWRDYALIKWKGLNCNAIRGVCNGMSKKILIILQLQFMAPFLVLWLPLNWIHNLPGFRRKYLLQKSQICLVVSPALALWKY